MINPEHIRAAKNSSLLADLVADMPKIAGTGGGEYASACPFCGGRDRFHVQPHNPGGPRWFCRQCTEGVWKDAIDFVMRSDGLGFRDAVEELAGRNMDMPMIHPHPPSVAVPRLTQAPNPAWQERGRAFVATCQERLWSDAGKAALKSLHKRGFTDDTILQARLGWNDQTRFDDRPAWGLPAELGEKGKPKRVWLPRGWVIPWYIDGELWRISIRRPKTDIGVDGTAGASSKYVEVSGGGDALYNADAVVPECFVAMVEGYFDALAIQQHAGDIVVPVATGSTTRCRNAKWIARLALAEAVLVAYDADKAGQDAAAYWLKVLPNAQKWRPWWDDPNQLAIDGVNLRDWLLPALPARLRKSVRVNEPSPAMRNRLKALLASRSLTPSEADEARRLGDLLKVKIRIENYDLNDPFSGWQAEEPGEQ